MASKLDQVLSPAEQHAWLNAPLLDGSLGYRDPPQLADGPYDDRIRLLLNCPEGEAFVAFLRGYIENGIPFPFDTQPGEGRTGWWNLTVEDKANRAHINIWRQYVLDIDFRIDDEGLIRGYGQVWIDKETAETGIASLSDAFAAHETRLKGRDREIIALALEGPKFEEIVEVFNLPWIIRAIRLANLDLMRGGQLSFGWQKFHIPKLVDAIFSPEGEIPNDASIPVTPLTTEVEALIWRRKNTDKFADPIFQRAGSKCELTGLTADKLLQACHIKPWADATEHERLDPHNGLCLAAHIHAAFDAHLLGFAPDGSVLYSDRFSNADRTRLNLSAGMRIQIHPAQRPYLEYRFAQFETANGVGKS